MSEHTAGWKLYWQCYEQDGEMRPVKTIADLFLSLQQIVGRTFDALKESGAAESGPPLVVIGDGGIVAVILPGMGEGPANAHLIKASPKLLAALEAMRRMASAPPAIEAMADAAIASARGEG